MNTESLTDTLRKTLSAFDEGSPMTTVEVADQFDIGRRSTYERLSRLVDKGALETKKVGANGRIWWRSMPGSVAESTVRSEKCFDENATQFELLVDAVEEYAIFMLNSAGQVHTWNSGARNIQGYREETILGEHISAFYTTEDRAAGVPDRDLARAAVEGSVDKEGWRVRADGSRFWASVTITALFGEDGELEGYATITKDTTESHTYEQDLRRERNLREHIIGACQVGVSVLTPEGNVLLVNDKARAIVGTVDNDERVSTYYGPEWNVYDADGGFVPPEERVFARVVRTGEPVEAFESQVERSNGERVWVSVTGVPVFDSGDEISYVVLTYEDVTQLKMQAQRLERERDYLDSELRDVFDRVDDAFAALDHDWRFTYVNDHGVELLQTDAGELLGTSVWELFPETVGARFEEECRRAMATNESVTFEEFYAPLEGWFEVRAFPSESGLSFYFQEITERKVRERDLEGYESVVEAVEDGIYVTDAEQHLQLVNEAYCKLVGQSREELLGAHIETVVGEDVLERAARIRDEQSPGERGRIEFDLTPADGETHTVETRYTLWTDDDGAFAGSVGVLRDVTARRERERELEEYETIVETMDEGVYIVDEDGEFVFVNEAYCKQTGYDREALLSNHVSLVVSRETIERAADLRNEFEVGDQQDLRLEADLVRPTGETIRTEATFASLERPDGDCRIGVVRDITERVEWERELRLYEAIVETMHDGVYVLDEAFHFEEVNDAYCEMTGYSREDLLGEHCTLVVSDEISQESADRLVAMAAEGGGGSTLEADIHRADGTSLRAESNFAPIPGDGPDHVRKVGVVRDVSERVAREHELEQYRTLTQAAKDVIVTIDEESTILSVNSAVADTFGYEPANLVGEPLTTLIPPDLADRHLADLQRYLESGIETPPWDYVDLAGRHFDGSTFPIAVSFNESEYEDERYFVGVIRDITERKEYERKLDRQRRRLAALNHLHEVIGDVTEAVIEQSTREEIEATVCERLAAADSYAFAWIGEASARTETIRLRTEAGVEGYFDGLDPTTDPADPRSDGPAARALRARELQIVADVREEFPFDEWRQTAREFNYRSIAAIPITHDSALYGVLCVYAPLPGAFADVKHDVLDRLGEIVGHAIAAVESKRALTSDHVHEIDFVIPNLFAEMDLVTTTDDRIVLDQAVPVSEKKWLLYGNVIPDDIRILEAMLDTSPTWEALRIFGETAGRASFELRLRESPILTQVVDQGGYVKKAWIDGADYHMTVQLPYSKDVRRFTDAILDAFPMTEIRAQRQVARTDVERVKSRGLLGELTDRQRTILQTAYFADYFEWPRGSSGEDISTSLGISSPTFSQHLRVAQQKIFKAAFDTDQ